MTFFCGLAEYRSHVAQVREAAHVLSEDDGDKVAALRGVSVLLVLCSAGTPKKLISDLNTQI